MQETGLLSCLQSTGCKLESLISFQLVTSTFNVYVYFPYTRTLSALRSLEITNLFPDCRFQVACQLKTFHSDTSYNHLNYFILQQSWSDIIQPYSMFIYCGGLLCYSSARDFLMRYVHNHLDPPYTMPFSSCSRIQLTILNTHVSRLP